MVKIKAPLKDDGYVGEFWNARLTSYLRLDSSINRNGGRFEIFLERILKPVLPKHFFSTKTSPLYPLSLSNVNHAYVVRHLRGSSTNVHSIFRTHALRHCINFIEVYAARVKRKSALRMVLILKILS